MYHFMFGQTKKQRVSHKFEKKGVYVFLLSGTVNYLWLVEMMSFVFICDFLFLLFL